MGREGGGGGGGEGGVRVGGGGVDGGGGAVEDDALDWGACRWTRGRVGKVAGVMAEVGRGLRPGGVCRFLGNGRWRDEGVAKWQRRLNGIQGVLFGGCQLDLHMDELISGAGIGVCEQGEFLGEGLRIYSSMYSGCVKKPE